MFLYLYINGKFIGGLDVIKELIENFELNCLLKLENNYAILNNR